MEYRQLGVSGPEVSAVGFGCWAIGGHGYGEVDDDASIAAIRAASEAGVNFFDTADVYGFGRSERVLARALGSEMKNAVIATKFGVCWDETGKTWRDSSPARVVAALDASLTRLGVERISLYQVHWPDGRTPLDATVAELIRQRDAGKICHIGVSNFPAAEIAACDDGAAVTSAQYEFNLLDRSLLPDIRECSGALGVGVVAYSVLARGILSAQFDGSRPFPPGDTRSADPNFHGAPLARRLALGEKLKQVGERRGATAAQVAIRWALNNSEITTAVVGAKTAAQARSNAAAAGVELDDLDMKELEQATSGYV